MENLFEDQETKYLKGANVLELKAAAKIIETILETADTFWMNGENVRLKMFRPLLVKTYAELARRQESMVEPITLEEAYHLGYKAGLTEAVESFVWLEQCLE